MVYFHSNAHISPPKQWNAHTGPEHQEQQLCSPEAAGSRVQSSPGALRHTALVGPRLWHPRGTRYI